jgi:hypothetical protein
VRRVLIDATRDFGHQSRSVERLDALTRAVAETCPRAQPAYDGLVVQLE